VPAPRKPLVVGLHVASVHDIAGYENNNAGAFIRYEGWTAGAFQNSVKKTAVYAAYTLEQPTPKVPLVDSVALTLGITTGYPEKIEGTDVSMLFVPTVAFKLTTDTRLRVAVLPAYQKFNRSTALHFMVEKSF
jgi:hypothetical protein